MREAEKDRSKTILSILIFINLFAMLVYIEVNDISTPIDVIILLFVMFILVAAYTWRKYAKGFNNKIIIIWSIAYTTLIVPMTIFAYIYNVNFLLGIELIIRAVYFHNLAEDCYLEIPENE